MAGYDWSDAFILIMIIIIRIAMIGQMIYMIIIIKSVHCWCTSSSCSGDLCEAGWDASEQEQEFDQLTEEDLRF